LTRPSSTGESGQELRSAGSTRRPPRQHIQRHCVWTRHTTFTPLPLLVLAVNHTTFGLSSKSLATPTSTTTSFELGNSHKCECFYARFQAKRASQWKCKTARDYVRRPRHNATGIFMVLRLSNTSRRKSYVINNPLFEAAEPGVTPKNSGSLRQACTWGPSLSEPRSRRSCKARVRTTGDELLDLFSRGSHQILSYRPWSMDIFPYHALKVQQRRLLVRLFPEDRMY